MTNRETSSAKRLSTEDEVWLIKFMGCIPFDPPVSEIQKAQRLVASLLTPSSERFTVIEECAKACEERFADPAWSADIRGAAATCASVIRRLLASPPTTAESGMALMAQNGMTIGDVLRIERAKYERAVDHLTRIYSLLNPPEVEAKGQRFRFNNPSANDTLQALSDAIRAIPEEMRSTPSTLAGSGWVAVKDRDVDMGASLHSNFPKRIWTRVDGRYFVYTVPPVAASSAKTERDNRTCLCLSFPNQCPVHGSDRGAHGK